MGIKAFISGCAGTVLSPIEHEFFSKEKPWGLILFQRNCETEEQIIQLITDFRSAVGTPNAPVLIDQEGGRVQRIKPPMCQNHQPSARLGDLYEYDDQMGLRAAWLQSRLIAYDIAKLGIRINCLPVLDVPQKNADQIIGDRAYAQTPDKIIKLASEAINGLMAGGVLPVMKHIPGHGRAECDSHLDLPIVEEKLEILKDVDFAPFKALNKIPLAMTAHIVYKELDSNHPATHSPKIITGIIRDYIGFEGCLMSDDLSMKALKGSLEIRTKNTFNAGCDLALHCNGNLEEMSEVASATPILDGLSLSRAQHALSHLSPPEALDIEGAKAELDTLMGHFN